MTTVSATEARKRLYALIDEVGQSHEPVQITGKRGNAVLLSEDDWRAIQETLHLVSIPGMRESILEGMATEVSELSTEPLGQAGPFCSPSRPRRTPASSPPLLRRSSRKPRRCWNSWPLTPISSHRPMKPWSGSCAEPAHGASTSSTGSSTRCWRRSGS